MSKVYIASTWENRKLLRPTAKHLTTWYNHEVTSTWIYRDNGESAEIEAHRDLVDIDRCDTFVLWPDEKRKHSTGKFFELGYAFAKGKRIIVVDRSTTKCVFLSLYAPEQIQFVSTWQQLYDLLEN